MLRNTLVIAVLCITGPLFAGLGPVIAMTWAPLAQDGSDQNLIIWLGGSVITSLIATISLLWRALNNANRSFRDALKSSSEKMEHLIEATTRSQSEVAHSISGLSEHIRDLVLSIRLTKES